MRSPVTISFGIAGYPERAETAASLVRAADERALHGEGKRPRQDRASTAATAEDSRVETAASRDIDAERFLAVILDLAEAVDVRFSGSARHSETVGRYAEMMARELGLSEHRVEPLRLAGILHDIGKVGVPDSILASRAS